VRVLVCGGRNYTDQEGIRAAILALPATTNVVVHGGAPGADSWAGYIAGMLGIPVEVHPADWARHGRAAGPIRNQEMLDSGIDLVVAFRGGVGTADMIRRAEKAGIEVRCYA
jgi:hypothetical protein